MGDLLRPPPPRTWRSRLAARWGAWCASMSPARLATGAGAVLLVAVTAWWLLRPGRLPVEASLPRAGASSTAPRGAGARASAAAAPGQAPGGATEGPPTTLGALVVQAAGAVVHPGVYRLADGARVADLVAAAGGPAADADVERVPLAARLADGQRVSVPRLGQPSDPAATPATGGAATGRVAGPIDLNAADVADLDTLPGVGPATAAAIVAYRDKHGRFRSVDDLGDVPGIGPAKLAALRDLVRT